MDSKPGRKLGHVTVLGSNLDSTLEKAQLLGNQIII
ncbi:hypothetical protein [Limnoraphis robusta]|uniref:Phosphoribosylaminoimidazole carboxylase C-terminal domain-containing protein n=1 Tax=Limnoraphis robusta CCNP1315 TaxID=3110306 RepID=A0ABU5U8K3_9CYAN|nr:hypothetical protein [Limnoraphis robusta]MEA5523375.1 hypothetical protein [Limnoraphis robusta CCNP1315]